VKKLPGAVGIILFLSSIIILLVSNIHGLNPYLDFKKEPNPVTVSISWNISRTFTRKNWIKLEITPPMDWQDYTEPPTETIPFHCKSVFVNITDPTGNETEMLCDFVVLQRDYPMYLYNITVTESHGLSDITYIGMPEKPGIIAKTMLDGNYTAYISGGMPGGSAPFEMRFIKGTIIVPPMYPYYNFRYLGVAVLVTSVILLVYSIKERRILHGRKKIAEKRRGN
jgi:hypothetical protein